jgi:hypothetical protein
VLATSLPLTNMSSLSYSHGMAVVPRFRRRWRSFPPERGDIDVSRRLHKLMQGIYHLGGRY